MIDQILNKYMAEEPLSREDALNLLSIDSKSSDFYKLISVANKASRVKFNNKGYIFAQIGINSEPCSGNCKFCSLSSKNFAVEKEESQSLKNILDIVRSIDFNKISALFLMTTADYSKTEFLNIGKEVRKHIPDNIILVANIGDFGNEYALELKKAGFGAAYHIVRLREGLIQSFLKSRE